MEFTKTKLTSEQAYKAMFQFLENYWNSTQKPSEIGILLGNLSLLEDEIPMDPAIVEDWNRCIELAISEKIDARTEST